MLICIPDFVAILPNDGTKQTFLKLSEEIEYLKRTHNLQKEELEMLRKQVADCLN